MKFLLKKYKFIKVCKSMDISLHFPDKFHKLDEVLIIFDA